MYQHAVDSYRLALGNESIKSAQTGTSWRVSEHCGRRHRRSGKCPFGIGHARKCGDPKSLVTCLVCLAGSLNNYGKVSAKAEPLWREALGLQRELGNDPLTLAQFLNGLAGSIGQDHEEESESLHREAVALYRRISESITRNTLLNCSHLANCYFSEASLKSPKQSFGIP